MSIADLLKEHGLSLPEAPKPVGNYKATLISGSLLHVSGQLPFRDGELVHQGQLGDLTTAQGQDAAELCALNLLSQIESALEGRELKTIVRVDGYINASQSFTEHAAVLNGASDLLAKVLGQKAGHIRTVIGCSSLPGNAAVEVSAVAEIE